MDLTSTNQPGANAPFGFIDLDAISRHAEAAPDGPVIALNLFKFKSREHAMQFMARSAEITLPHFERIGAKVLYSGDVGAEFVMGDDWDAMFMVQYPSFADLRDTALDEGTGGEIQQFRNDALDDARLLLIVPHNAG